MKTEPLAARERNFTYHTEVLSLMSQHKDTLLVRARGLAMCPDFEAQEARIRRFIGRKHDPKAGKAGGWPSTGKAQEVPNSAEYVMAVQRGELWAADKATADLCGVVFDPTFGGEPVETAPAEKPAKAAKKSAEQPEESAPPVPSQPEQPAPDTAPAPDGAA